MFPYLESYWVITPTTVVPILFCFLPVVFLLSLKSVFYVGRTYIFSEGVDEANLFNLMSSKSKTFPTDKDLLKMFKV